MALRVAQVAVSFIANMNNTRGWQTRFHSLGLVGAVGGAVVGALSAQAIGRRRTMAVGAIGALCTWLCIGCAQEVWYLYTGRFINGFFAGMLSLVVPAQISELADTRNRGVQGARHFIGMLIGSIYVTLLGRYVIWSTLAFACLLPPAILLPLSWFLVESPRWLLQVGQRERAMAMQRNLRKEPVEANAEFKLMERAFSRTPTPSLHYWLATHIMFSQQFCGANMAATCASVLIAAAGVYADKEDADLAILITQVAVACAALPLVDTVGRLRLLVVSANICVVSMILLGSMYPNMPIDATNKTTTSTPSPAANATELDAGGSDVPGSRLGLVFLIVFFFGYALGIGSVAWIQLNPEHTVPTINDNGFVLWESRAIGMYLVDKYAPESTLYPKDLQKRATVNRLVFFESGTLLSAQMAYFRPKWFKGQEPTADLKEAYDKALGTAVTLLGDKKFLCGDNVTLADIGLACTLGVVIEGTEYEGLEKFPQLKEFYQRFKKALPEYEQVAADALKIIRDMVARARSGQNPHGPPK